MNISERLKEQMKIRKLSVPALSEKTGISENTIKNYLYRGQEPRADAMLVLANALNVSASYLLGETDDPDLPYWEDPDITADLDNIDEQLLHRFLSAYRNADAETKFYAQDVMAQLTKVLEKATRTFGTAPPSSSKGSVRLRTIFLLTASILPKCRRISAPHYSANNSL